MQRLARLHEPIDRPGVAEVQGGAFTAAQARTDGWSKDRITRLVRYGHWHRLPSGALTALQPPFGVRLLSWGAQLRYPGAVVSHTTAAHLLGWPIGPDGVIHLSGRGRTKPGTGVRVHQQPVTEHEARLIDDGLLVTAPRRTAVDCLCALPRSRAEGLWAFLLSRNLLRPSDVAAAAAERTGRHGVTQLLHIARLAQASAANPGELLLQTALRRAGLTGWEPDAVVMVEGRVIARVDVLFRAHKIVIELDGYGPHSGREAFVADRRRHNDLVAAGYTVLRTTWRVLSERPEELVAQVRRTLATKIAV